MYIDMATKVTQRDTQRAKFYTWMHRFENLITPAPTLEAYLIEAEIIEAVKSYGHPEPRVVFHKKGVKSRFGLASRSEVYFKRYEAATAVDISTLVGWLIYENRKTNLQEGWHGPTFCRVWAETYAHMTSTPVKDIVDSMRAAGLKVRAANGAAPASPGIIKKFEKSKNRVIELEAAIKRGRQEFEEFLQPILNELAKAKVEVKTLETKIRG
jgi:hypothetical protein